MKYSIVYSSRTGNTALLADAIRGCLPEGAGNYFGAPSPEGARADFVFAGFWTDRGCCDGDMADFLRGLRDKRVFLFGTAGFGADPGYFAQILARVQSNLDRSNVVAGSFLCQGKMPSSVRKRYESMANAGRMLENFDRALSHPDAADLEGLRLAVREALAFQ